MLFDTNVVSSFLKRGVEARTPKLFSFVNDVITNGNLTISR
ncbi:MAG TPA: hypothetical protein VHC69_34815 [Polyangiaceae bacterium]|nr:hypothetical protein [Polyangiaceae bacterium]